ncbi:hypothetical protein G7046_g9639 [Stylonectria norvegica]|nr:hypothetical protein G7046_g9639 [Stylonectria norvegica]
MVPPTGPPTFAVLDYLFPGFSMFSSAVHAYLGIDLNLYIPMLLAVSSLTFAWTYFSDYVWGMVEKYLMSVVRIRTDDEIYNMIMTWVASQRFAQSSRRFIVNTNVNSRSWFLWRWNDEEDEDEAEGDGSDGSMPRKKPLQYTPSFGTHYFWYNGSLLLFERHENREQSGFLVVSEREEITISCFGRNPRVLKDLLLDARLQYMKKDECKTLIYRGTASGTSGDPSWQRCMSRSSRPFSTVILSEKTKTDLIDDVTDYLNPATRRWYSNRGIPYRRGYLLYGPPGTGKSSLSLALAGFFRMRIYMVSLSSVMANEENLSTLFAELPRRCVVLLEDIDTAGLTHTRENGKAIGDGSEVAASPVTVQSGPGKPAVPVSGPGRLSLSGLLNILDGVASQEGRVLIMTTNHLEKLDKALIRPGRVDMIVRFGLADADMTAALFRAIYAPYEGEEGFGQGSAAKPDILNDPDKAQALAEKAEKVRKETVERISILAKDFATKIPELEFSPAEIQGLLLKHKRNPEAVIDATAEWIIETRKEKKQKEIDDAEKRRTEEAKRKKEEAKKKRKEEKAKARKKKAKAKRKAAGEDSATDSGSESDSESETESEADGKKKDTKDTKDTKDADKANKTETSDVASTEKKGDTETATKTEQKEADAEKKPENKELVAVEKGPKGTSDSGYDTPEQK